MGDWNYGYAGHLPEPFTPEETRPSPGAIFVQMYVELKEFYSARHNIVRPDTSRKRFDSQVGKVLKVGWDANDLETMDIAPLRNIQPGMLILTGVASGAELTFASRPGEKYRRLIPADILCILGLPEGANNPFEVKEDDAGADTRSLERSQ